VSNKKEREKRREARLAEEAKTESKDRRTRLLQLGSGAVFLVIAAVVVLIVVSSSNSKSGGDASNVKEAAEVERLLAGIPQAGLTLGDPKAPVELIEYGDLQCPICKEYSEEILPGIIEGAVKQGEAKITFRNFAIIGEESISAGTAALAAGAQGRGWNYLELFYRNQGKERSGYVTDEFMTSIAKGAGVEDIPAWNKERNGSEFREELEATSSEAENELGFTGTPSFAIRGPSTKGLELLNTPSSTAAFEEAIESAS
jgi:protein-disulfide isomerase